jgi:hypothetical protein
MGARTGAVKLPHWKTASGKESSNLWKWRVEFLWRIASRKNSPAPGGTDGGLTSAGLDARLGPNDAQLALFRA